MPHGKWQRPCRSKATKKRDTYNNGVVPVEPPPQRAVADAPHLHSANDGDAPSSFMPIRTEITDGHAAATSRLEARQAAPTPLTTVSLALRPKVKDAKIIEKANEDNKVKKSKTKNNKFHECYNQNTKLVELKAYYGLKSERDFYLQCAWERPDFLQHFKIMNPPWTFKDQEGPNKTEED